METREKNIRKKALYISNLGLMDNLGMTQILPYIEGLAHRGVRITALSFEKKENLLDRDKLKMTQGALRRQGVKWLALQYHKRWGNLYDMLKAAILAAVVIIRDRIDVVHARASIPIMISWPLGRLFGKKIIYDRRGTMKGDFIDDVNIKNIFSTRFFSGLLDKMDNFFIRHSDAVIVLTEKSKDLLAAGELSNRKNVLFDFVPCCVDAERFKTHDLEALKTLGINDRFVIAYVGSLGTCYLLDEMIDFFLVLKKTIENAFFLIVSHSDRELIKRHFTSKGVNSNDYTIIGATPSDVPALIGLARFSIMFIMEVECKIGSSPTKFAESLMAGVPIIINKGIGDTQDIVSRKKVGVIVKNLNEGAYSAAISDILEMLKEGRMLADRCRDTALEFFSIEMGVEKYARIYANIEGKK